MATHNGGKFIQEQLESLSWQTVLPDEVVICDDMSQDNTVEVISEFLKTSPFKIYLHINKKRLGYSKNFSKDVKDGDVVLAFLSRSYHESVKNKNAYILTEIGDNNNTNLSDQFLFYSRPKGKYSGNDTKNLLLDFYLVNI